MGPFIKKSVWFGLISLLIFCAVLSIADGASDPFYLRFTTPKQENLVIGTSRSAQGIQPSVIKELSGGLDFYNFSFTVAHSPFGPVYLDAIKKKVKKGNKRSTFIVSVDPWSISSTSPDPNNEDDFREKDLALGKVNFVNVNPNLEYLFKMFTGNYHLIIERKFNERSMILKDDGWLMVTVPMDSVSIYSRTKKKLSSYRDQVENYRYSSKRLEYLKKTLEYLKDHGEVIVVRLPIHPEMMKIEEGFMPDFNEKVNQLSPYFDSYLDFTNKNGDLEYTDGNHLSISSGRIVSQWITDSIMGSK